MYHHIEILYNQQEKKNRVLERNREIMYGSLMNDCFHFANIIDSAIQIAICKMIGLAVMYLYANRYSIACGLEPK